MNIKTIAVVCATVMCAGACLARPFGPGHHGGFHHSPPMHHGGFHRPPPMHRGWHHPPHYHHRGCWGVGGRYFWPGFVGGVVGGALASTVIERNTVVVQPTTTVVTTPAVVQQPVQQTQNVWVEGRYVDQVQPNGTVVRVWQPGHYEQQTVIIQ